MKKAVYPGTFDPLTIGHLDIIKRAVRFVDELHVVVADNYKKTPTFSTEERITMIKRVTEDIPNIIVTSTEDLVVRYAMRNDIDLMIRGLRNIADYENEYMLYQFNRNLNKNIETIILFPSSRNHFVSSSAIKELIVHHADISPYVPKEIIRDVQDRLRPKSNSEI
ncbi:MAG: pantetheine-phosphate adenylyltransferase [Acholeplasmataceae bacterium]|jgi:pantetheine-phosphate adenylyltransferase|nr:pantetheine-phosphate adenylyltransferase [Acholeplasmataceae bacterium]